MKKALFPFMCALLLAVTGCELNFGEDVELSGAAFDATKLAEISSLTGIKFPAAARGLEYLYLGSGIDDSLAAKIQIPEEEVEEFLKNAVFTAGADSKASIQIGKDKAWWKIDGLRDRVDRKQDLPNARFLEVTYGREGADFVVYVSWMTT